MSPRDDYDAVVVGAGPNGLAAAITLAQSGHSVLVVEAAASPGGGTRSAELTLPGFVHDVCSAIHPLAVASPFFDALPLAQHGLSLAHPEHPFAQPLDGGRAALVHRSVDDTAAGLGRDGPRYRRLMAPLVRHADAVLGDVLAPARPPRHPVLMARFGWRGLRSAARLAARFDGDAAPAILAGVSAHSMLSLRDVPTAAYGLVLAMTAHAVGWPTVVGGSQHIADAMTSYLQSLGGEVRCNGRVDSLDQLPHSRAVLLDVTPRQLVQIAGDRLPRRYRRRLERYRYGVGTFKVDWALDGPIPWAADECRGAGTLHIGGTFDELAAAEDEVVAGGHPERPFVLLAQQSVFDPSRAPTGRHTAWGYCHVPNGSTVDMTERIERQIERFAPGFRDRVLARSIRTPAQLESYNANYVGGDINGGVQDLRQLFTRPVARLDPYSTPAPGIYLCSSSTPPGGGVHGMCGFWAARSALRRSFGQRIPATPTASAARAR
ncbi:MAG: phytoene desaturase family protein [Mycobacteriales bacterium]